MRVRLSWKGVVCDTYEFEVNGQRVASDIPGTAESYDFEAEEGKAFGVALRGVNEWGAGPWATKTFTVGLPAAVDDSSLRLGRAA